MNKEQVWNIILVISLVLIVHGITQTGSSDKKEAQAGTDETTLGVVGAVSSVVGRKLVVVPAFVWGWGVFLSVVALVPMFFRNIISMFSPQPSIPIWVWVIGFVVILLFVLKKK